MYAADAAAPVFVPKCRTRDSQAHLSCSLVAGLGTGRPHLQAKGRGALSLSIRYIGLQVTFLLPALDKNPKPRRFVD